jgi:hypothetical protein
MTFGGRVDASIVSRGDARVVGGGHGHGGGEGAVELAGDVALEAAPDLLWCLAFGGASGDVGLGGGAAACSGHGDGVDGAVERPVSAAVESVAQGAAAAGLEWAGAGEGGDDDTPGLIFTP